MDQSIAYPVKQIIIKVRGMDFVMEYCPFTHTESFVPLCNHPEHANDLPKKTCYYDGLSHVAPPSDCPLNRNGEDARIESAE